MKRREFLKVLGVTGAGAAALGCQAEPAHRLIPYLVQPDEIVPGVPTVYASVCRECPAGCGIHVRTREGRAIKVEGNPDHPVNRGKLCARGEAALQGLYHPDRVRQPMLRDEGGGLRPVSWEEAEAWLVERVRALAGAGRGRGIAFLGAPDDGTFGWLVDRWLDALGGRPRVAYDPFAPHAWLEANRIAFGVAEWPELAIDEAGYIVAFGADFLETWGSPVEQARRFAEAHGFRNGRIAKFVFVGPRLSLTGANADAWVPARPGTEFWLALGMARAIVASGRARAPTAELGDLLDPFTPEAVEAVTGVPAARVETLAREFADADPGLALPGGTALEGAQATAAHVAVNLLNYVAGNVGRTVRFGTGPTPGRASSFREIVAFTEALGRGEVALLLVHGANPVHTLPGPLAAAFAEALESRVPAVVAFARVLDETAAKAHLVLPEHHPLEAWGDAPARPGVWGLQQPVMRPVFQSRAAGDVLLAVARALGPGVADRFPWPDMHALLRERWRELARALAPDRDPDETWAQALRQGGLYAEPRPREVRLSPEVRRVRFEPPELEGPADGLALVAYPHPYWYDGRGADKPWLQELPDPMTRIAWTAWAELHPKTAEGLGVRNGDLVELRTDSGTVTLPAYVYRGVREDTVAVPLGQGHTQYGRYAAGRSASPLPLLPARTDPVSGARAWLVTRAAVRRQGGHQPLPILQTEDTDHGREVAELVAVAAAREAEAHAQAELQTHPDAVVEAAWDADPKSPYRWGMVIDLAACIGCNACVVACSAENNVPVVGERHALLRREMQWIRIERYFEEGEGGAFQTVHVPMLCQQCGNAPCEPVCPVYATYHTAEGLNAQVYNRCVGTRYCSNNCPYKVRRFNFFHVATPDRPAGPRVYEGFPFPLNLQLNPDVTVRDKGVMEKCTFCVQRIAAARERARAEGRLVRDGEVVPACAQTCPTDAIVFGNLRDPNSRVARLARSGRAYHVLAELNTRPAVTYLREVTHNEAVAKAAAARHTAGAATAGAAGDERGREA